MSASVRDEIFGGMDSLSPAEKKVARTLLAGYPASGLASASRLAERAGTSTPTVLRLLTRLGLGSYPDFQERLRHEVGTSVGSPLSRAESSLDVSPTQPFPRSVSLRSEIVAGLVETVPPAEFDAAVAALAAARRVIMAGGYFSRYVVEILGAQLDELRPGISIVREPQGRDSGLLIDLDHDAVVVLIDMRRYELTTKRLAEAARAQGAKIILLTDTDLSPVADIAQVVLPVPVSAAPFDSFAALLALAESLVDAVFHQLGKAAVERMRQWERSLEIDRVARARPSTGSVGLKNPRGPESALLDVPPSWEPDESRGGGTP